MGDQQPPKLVVGLGNPGREYERTRHNAGFMVVDEVVARYGLSSWKTKDSARQIYDASRRIVFVEPTSYMNLSGTPVRLISSWYKTPPEGVLVVVDDMDLPYGTLRMRPFGGHGGHNGLRSIIATIGDRFPRIRVGVGRPEYESIDHVLGPFSKEEREVLPQVIDAAADGVVRWLDDGLEDAMQWVNNWVLKS
ncbi:MAG TPA: aminoacyl-tRNA hydrolase [Candidatus Aquilonibacter sp.]